MTSAHTYQPPHLIDTAPLSARCDYLTQAILAFIAAGHMGLVLRYSQKLLRVIRVHNRLTGANILLRRKRDMLYNSAWRRRVLWGLGGRERLRRWDEMNARFMPRLETKSAESLYSPFVEPPAWLNTPERIAESERLKARVRKVRRAAVHPNIFRDRVKTDFEGLFRLPPLPRKTRLPSTLKIYTQNTISDYDWNPIPYAKQIGFGPACVWPAEFYAAMIADGEMTEAEVDSTPLSFPRKRESNRAEQYLLLDPRMRGDDKNENRIFCAPLPLKDVLSPKVWNDIFSPLPQEASLARS